MSGTIELEDENGRYQLVFFDRTLDTIGPVKSGQLDWSRRGPHRFESAIGRYQIPRCMAAYPR